MPGVTVSQLQVEVYFFEDDRSAGDVFMDVALDLSNPFADLKVVPTGTFGRHA